MRVYHHNGEVVYDSVRYEEDTNRFVMYSKTSDPLYCYSPLRLKTDDVSNYALYKLSNERKDYSENDILKVFIEKRQIGWLIPFSSLISIDHDYSNDESFQRISYVAYCKILEQLNTIIDASSSEVDLEELCFSNKNEKLFSSVLVVSRESLGDAFDESWVNDYLVGLFRFGFSKSGKGNLSPLVGKNENHKITLKRNSQYICDNLPQVNLLFESVSAEDIYSKQFVRFLMYYQFIELLMGVLLELQLNSYLSSISTSRKRSSRALLETKSKVDSLLDEKRKITILLNNCSIIPNDEREQVDTCCKVFLRNNDPEVAEKSKNFADSLYRVRCFIVHSLYSIDDTIDMELQGVNDAFLEVLESLLLSFDPSLYFEPIHE